MEKARDTEGITDSPRRRTPSYNRYPQRYSWTLAKTELTISNANARGGSVVVLLLMGLEFVRYGSV